MNLHCYIVRRRMYDRLASNFLAAAAAEDGDADTFAGVFCRNHVRVCGVKIDPSPGLADGDVGDGDEDVSWLIKTL